MTKEQLKSLAENWGLVIKEIYPDIDIVTKGEDTSVASLLSEWHHGDVSKPMPSETELLFALQAVQVKAAKAAIVRAEILDQANLSAGTTYPVLIDDTPQGSLITALLLQAGALDENGKLKPVADWMSS